MGNIQRIDTGRSRGLLNRSLVGRGPTCRIRVDHSAVSREHAVLYWSEGVWEIKDLGSRNGTIVDGKRLGSDSQPLRQGAEIKFGDDGVVFQLVDASAPQAFAIAPDGTEHYAEADLLILPDHDTPLVTIFKSKESGWVYESEGMLGAVGDHQTVSVDGALWQVHVPAVLEVTEDAGGPALATMRMVFRVSRDEEYVELEMQGHGRSIALKARAFTYMLLTLARLRVKDAEGGELPLAEHGWVHQDDLGVMLACDRATLNVHVCRARRQLATAQISGAADVIERRSGTGQLRIGVSALKVEAF